MTLAFKPFLRTPLALFGLLLLTATACSAENPRRDFGFAGTVDGALGVRPGAGVQTSALGDYLAGTVALDSGRIEEAVGYFESALAAEPDNLELLQQLFLLTLADGRYDTALEQAERLVERDPAADEARLLLALEGARAEDFEAARERLEGIRSSGIAALALPFLDAWAILGADLPGATDAALARLEEGESLGPLNLYHSAMLLDLGGRTAEARELLRDALPDSGRAPVRMVQAYAGMLARDGETGAAIALLRQQLADGREQPILEQALRTLEEGEPLPLPFESPAGGMADALLGIAEALHQERGAARAVIYARLARFLEPELAEAALLIGEVMAEQENYEAAIEAYRSVDEGSPLHYAAGLRTARALYELERQDEAFALLEELAGRAPERTEALVRLGDLLRREEAYERAGQAYSRAIARIGEPEREHWTLFYARGITYERTDRWPEAEQDFLRALELEPEQPFVLNYLGYSWVDQGMNLDEAKDMLHRAVELRPNDGFIVDSLGWVHYRLGEYEDAVEELERAVELEPGDPVINDHLGDAYWRVGREREARFQWQRALSLEPEEGDVAEIEEKLESGLPDEPANPT